MSQTTTTIDLENFGNTLLTKQFYGVVPLDELPKYSSQDFTFIVNTDTSNLPGTHWIAVIIRDNRGFVFNTFGIYPPPKLKYWLDIHCHKWSCNKRQIQSYSSNLCGYFCIHFLYFATMTYLNNVSFYEIINILYPEKMSLSTYEQTIIDFFSNKKL